MEVKVKGTLLISTAVVVEKIYKLQRITKQQKGVWMYGSLLQLYYETFALSSIKQIINNLHEFVNLALTQGIENSGF